jgi:hypothetical protein
MSMSRTQVIVTRLIVLAALAGLPGLGEATPPRGGSGGSGFTLDCGSDSVLAGVVVRAGTMVDAVEAICVKVNADGSWAGGSVNKGKAGGSGGAPMSLSCDGGWAVMGIHGRSGSLVDREGQIFGRNPSTASGGNGARDILTIIPPTGRTVGQPYDIKVTNTGGTTTSPGAWTLQ